MSLDKFQVYGTFCTTYSSEESGLIVEFWGVIRINREIWIDDLKVVIDIFNSRGIDECNRVDTTTYPHGGGNVPVPVHRKAV